LPRLLRQCGVDGPHEIAGGHTSTRGDAFRKPSLRPSPNSRRIEPSRIPPGGGDRVQSGSATKTDQAFHQARARHGIGTIRERHESGRTAQERTGAEVSPSSLRRHTTSSMWRTKGNEKKRNSLGLSGS
jgi:hypothetical protein